MAQIGTVKYNAQTGAQVNAWFYDSPENQGSTAFEVAVGKNGAIYVGGETTYKTTYFDFTTLQYVDAELGNPTVTSNSMLSPGDPNKSMRLSAFPNPINSSGTIQFDLPEEDYTRISVIDNSGREIRQISSAKYSEGTHNIKFNRTTLPSGTYYIRLQTQTKRLITKVILTQ